VGNERKQIGPNLGPIHRPGLLSVSATASRRSISADAYGVHATDAYGVHASAACDDATDAYDGHASAACDDTCDDIYVYVVVRWRVRTRPPS
jgi:hypothetical protein